MPVRDLIAELLAVHGLQEPDGRALYAYRVEPAQLHRLRDGLREELRLHPDLRGHRARGFCLFAAGYIHREADRDAAWSWDTVREPCGLRCSYVELQDAVEEGLRFWKRPLIRDVTGRQFLVTLLIEGGLPLSFLRQEGTRFRDYLRNLLREKETYPKRTAIDIARASDVRLPVSLRRREVHELTAALIEAIVDLRRTAPNAEAALRLLREREWMRRLPIALDDSLAMSLLSGLVKEPRERVAAGQQPMIETVLRLGVNPGLERRVRSPAFVDAQVVAASIGRKAEELPARFYLAMEVCDGGRQSVVTATRSEDEYAVSVGRYRPVVSHHLVREEVQFIISTGLEELGRFVPLGGQALSDAPLVFRDDDVEARLVGTGSYRSSAASLS